MSEPQKNSYQVEVPAVEGDAEGPESILLDADFEGTFISMWYYPNGSIEADETNTYELVIRYDAASDILYSKTWTEPITAPINLNELESEDSPGVFATDPFIVPGINWWIKSVPIGTCNDPGGTVTVEAWSVPIA